MDWDYARCVIQEAMKGNKKKPVNRSTPYRKLLDEAFNMNKRRILAFKDKPPRPTEAFPGDWFYTAQQWKARRYIPQTPERTLDAPDLIDDDSLNLLDWGSSNILAIALGSTVYLWNATDDNTTELVTVDDESGPVTSVKWAPDGCHISVGLNNADVQLWDSTANSLLWTLKSGHRSRVNALDWNNHHMLTTGGMDGQILSNDIRIPSSIVQTYVGHHQEVCRLKWSTSGRQLASSGNDSLVHIWDTARTSRYLHRLKDHTAPVKALAWCPFQTQLLASGGGDNNIKFWDTHSGACLNSVDTGSQVSALEWNKKERELLSAHGLPHNQLTLWKYPSMVQMTDLTAHTSPLLFMAQSPDGCTVASASDENLLLWNVFGDPKVAAKATAPKTPEPFAHFNRSIR